MVCDRRILQGGWWHIRRARGDLAGDVHRGCAVGRNAEGQREISIHRGTQNREGKIKEQYIMEFTSGVPWWLFLKKKTHGKLYPGRKVTVALRFMLGALQKKQRRVEILRRF